MGGTTSDRKRWESDATRADGPTSLNVLIAWLQTEGNYVRWKGNKRVTGESKEKLCKEILTKMHDQGLTHRTTRDVRNKMTEFERGMRRVGIWQIKRGGRLMDLLDLRDNLELRATILKHCRYFMEVADVMVPVIARLMEATNNTSPSNRSDDDDDDDDDSGSDSSMRQKRPQVAEASAKRHRRAQDVKHEIQESKLLLEKQKLELEAAQLAAEQEHIKLDLERRRIQVVTEKTLARQQLRTAGVPEHEIDKAFPLPSL